MKRKDVIRGMALKSGLTQDQCKLALNALIEVLQIAARHDETVIISQLGKLSSRMLPERTRLNPVTGERVVVSPSRKVMFSLSDTFKRMVQ